MKLEGDGSIHSHISITYPVYKEYGSRLDWLEKFSSHVSVSIGRQPSRAAYSEVTDVWGCHWIYPLESLDGQCDRHPIATWADLKTYRPPDPDKYTDWAQAEKNVAETKAKGNVAWGGTDHGFIFLRLTYLRGFHNLMLDIAEERPELDELIRLVEGYWFEVCRRWVELGVDAIGFGDDMGLQRSLPISPASWKKYIKPSYQRILGYCRSHGVYTSLHSDGYIVDIIPDLIELGVSILNPQDLVNGLENIRRLAKGKLFINLDIDRQKITPFGTPQENEEHIIRCVQTLGSPTGGLSTIWGVYPHTPIENIEAVARALDKYATYWVGRKA